MLVVGSVPFTIVQAAEEVEINTIEDLDNMRSDLAGDYRLMRDLDFEDCASYANCSNMSDFTSGAGWVPVGDTTDRFTGQFNGDGYDISNLYIHDQTDNNSGIGLFGAVNNGRITDVTLENPQIDVTGNSTGVGGVIGYMTGGESSADYLYIDGGTVYSTGTQVGGIIGSLSAGLLYSNSTAAVRGAGQVGGLVGYLQNSGLIYRSYANSVVGNANVGPAVVGGLAGVNLGTIEESYAAGWVNGSTHTGGLAGINGGTITNSFALGSVVASNNNAGGLVGTSESGAITETYAAVCVTSTSSNYAGGLVGRDLDSTVGNSFYDQEVANRSDSGKGLGRTTTQMKATSTYTDLGNWSVNGDGDAWLQNSESNHGYPYLNEVYMIEFDIANCGSNAPSNGGGNGGNNGGNNPDPTPPALTDVNADGIDDADQPNVVAFASPITGKTVAIVLSDECEISASNLVQESTFVAQDAVYEYSNGLFDFAADCESEGTPVSLYYYDIPKDGLTLRKHNPNDNTYFDIQNASISEQTLNNQKVTVATYTITDGGELDMDGEVNGRIVDPAGLGHTSANSSADLANTGQSIQTYALAGLIIVCVGLITLVYPRPQLNK